MDINTLRGLATVFVMIAFFGVCWWAYGPKRKRQFEEAAQLPFADEAESDLAAKRDAASSSELSTEKERQNTL